MPSPFPGMNPYLERPGRWADFHNRFLVYAAEALLPQLLPDYYVSVEEHLFVQHYPDEDDRLVGRADVAVSTPDANGSPPVAAGGTAVVAPVVGLTPVPVLERQSYLEIRDQEGNMVLTVIELLSPTNKRPGRPRDQYLAKREQVLDSPANLVEIDLLRGGHRPPVEGLPLCDYYALVSRPVQRPEAGLWPIRMRDRLPELPIPVTPARVDATLDLQALLHKTYDAGGFAVRIYGQPPAPRLAPEDAAWAAQFTPTPP
ncbi:MAG TPA: DUF4058 family protein, partial [Gemmataceae bacterium]